MLVGRAVAATMITTSPVMSYQSLIHDAVSPTWSPGATAPTEVPVMPRTTCRGAHGAAGCQAPAAAAVAAAGSIQCQP